MAQKFAERLATLRKAAGLSQAALAKKAGLSLGAITNLEQGRREPSWSTVQSLARGLGVSVAAFETNPKKGK